MKNKTAGIHKNLENYLLLIFIAFVIIYFIIYYRNSLMHINFRGLKRYILSFGPTGFLVLLLIYSLKPVLMFFPVVPLTILAGNLYGFYGGLLLTTLGLFFSGSFAFYISRNLGEGFVKKILKKKFLKIEKSMKEHGFKIMFMMRISTVFPYDPLSYAAGVTNISYSDFILGSLLGTIPEMIIYLYLGHHAERYFSRKIIFPAVIFIILAIAAPFLYKKYKKTPK